MKTIARTFAIGTLAGIALVFGCSAKESPALLEAPAAGGPVEIKIAWPPGQKYAFRMELTRTTETASTDGRKPTIEVLRVAQDFEISVPRNATGANTRLELGFSGQRIETDAGGRNRVIFDSSRDPSMDNVNEAGPMFRNMMGARIHYLLDATGKVQGVEDYEALAQQIGGGKEQSTKIFRNIFPEALLKAYCSFGNKLPPQPVKMGDTWPAKGWVLGPDGLLGSDLNYTFKALETHGGRHCVRLDYAGSIPAEPDPMTKGTVSGTAWFDPALGMLVDAAKHELLTLKETGKPGVGVSQVKQEITMRLKSVSESGN